MFYYILLVNTQINKITLFAVIYLFLLAVYLFLLAWRDGRDTRHLAMNSIPSLRSQSSDIAQYPEFANQSNRAVLGGSCVAYTKRLYKVEDVSEGATEVFNSACVGSEMSRTELASGLSIELNHVPLSPYL